MNPSPLVVSILAVAVLAVVFHVVALKLRGDLYRGLEASIEKGDLDAFFMRVDSRLVRALLAPYGRERLRFKALAAAGDKPGMAEQFSLLMKLKLTDYERSCLLTDGFDAFAGLGDRVHCQRILDAMEGAGFTDRALAAYHRHFDLVLAGKTAGWKDLENSYAALTGRRRGYAAYVLSCVHKTLNDGKDAVLRAEACRLLGVPDDQLDRRIHVNTTV